MKMIQIGALSYHRPSDEAAMRLLRAFFRVASEGDEVGNIAFWELLATHLITPHNRPFIQMIRRELGPTHPNCKMNERAHWLAVQIGGDTEATRQTLATLTRMPKLFFGL